ACPKLTNKRLQKCSLPASPTPVCASKITHRSKSRPGGNASTPGSAREWTCTRISSMKTPARRQRMLASFSEKQSDLSPPQQAAQWLVAFVEEHGCSGNAGARLALGGVPSFAIEGLDGLQLFLLKRLVYAGQFLGNEGVELAGHVIQFFLQRVDARDLIVPRPSFVIQNGSVELRRFFA